ncbi:MAG: PcfJ domain-containing protein, partial [Bacteriovoracaceae bacterium]|nr:PcfJ domain-containing protein [Bacteriovoracaceae bacterium]
MNVKLVRNYHRALRRNISFELYDLHKKNEIQLFFNFLGPIYEDWVERRMFHMLELPYFKPFYLTDFNKMVDFIFKCDAKRYRKRVGKLVQEHGVRALNNLYALHWYFPLENPDKYFNFDFSELFIPFDLAKGSSIRALFRYYGIKRFSRLYESALHMSHREVHDTAIMVRRSLNNNDGLMPKKPKNIREIHDTLSFFVGCDIEHLSTTFTQELDFLNGVQIEGGRYTIEAPRSYVDLVKTGEELHHCVGKAGYVNMILAGECQILNLLNFDGKRVYS